MPPIHKCEVCDFRFGDADDTIEMHDHCFEDFVDATKRLRDIDHEIEVASAEFIDTALRAAAETLDKENQAYHAVQRLREHLGCKQG